MDNKCAFLSKRWTFLSDPKLLNGSLYTVPVKGLDTPTHSRVFIYFYYFVHCRIIVKTSTLWNKTWNHVVTKKVLNKSKYIKNAVRIVCTVRRQIFGLSHGLTNTSVARPPSTADVEGRHWRMRRIESKPTKKMDISSLKIHYAEIALPFPGC